MKIISYKKYLSFINKLFFLFQLYKCIDINCNKSYPILKENKCVLTYCSEEQFDTSTCIINNQIIKTQWLTNIMRISDKNFRYVSPFLTENKDLIILTTSVSGTSERKYFGIANDGRYYFKNSEGEESPYFSINANKENDNDIIYKYEGSATAIRLANDEKDYFLNIGNQNTFTELIDYQNNIISRILTNIFYYVIIVSEKNSIFLMSTQDGEQDKKYYIISIITSHKTGYYYMCKIYYFNSTIIENGYERVVNNNNQSANRRMSSCFQSSASYSIFCFYQNNVFEFTIIIYEPKLKLNHKLNKTIDTGESNDENNIYIFFKGIHLVDDVGFYLYYKSINSKPTIAIKEYNGNNIIDYKSYQSFTLDKYSFNGNLLFNDIIQIKSYQICFSSTSNDKDILYIVIFNFYKNYYCMNIRYYTIELYQLYHKKFLLELILTPFGKYISLSSSFCSNTNCDSNDDEHYSYLMIFSYPNSTDINFDFIQHLIDTNENITNNNINLYKYIKIEKIENNIFGYIFKEIRIISVPENINIVSTLNNNEIKENYILNQNENISISISLDNQNIYDEYIIKYVLVYTDPKYVYLKNYSSFIDESYGDETENEYYEQEEYIGRTSYFKIIKNGTLTSDCDDDECSLCKKGTNNDYTCIIKNIKTINIEKTYFMSTMSSIPFLSTLPSLQSSTVNNNVNNNIKIYECSNKDILNNKCNRNLTNEQIEDIYTELKNILNDNYTNENIIIITNNAAFQLSLLKDQKSEISEYSFISNIDLGECNNLIKNKGNLTNDDDLIILKLDILNDDDKSLLVQYEIYHPYLKTKLDLHICQNTSTYINTPIILTSEVESLYNSLNKSGYNLFNYNDSFYNDICSPYTSENDTDIPMNDRYDEIYNNINNYTICQNNCTFMYYNSTIKKAKCECEVQVKETITNKTNINYKKELILKFYTTLTNSNFLILKCYKLVFSLKGQINNYGNYIMGIILLMFISLIFIYFILENKKINIIIKKVINQKKRGLNQTSFNTKNKAIKINNSNKVKKNITDANIKNKTSNKKNFSKFKNSVKIDKKPKKEPPPKYNASKANYKSELKSTINLSKNYLNSKKDIIKINKNYNIFNIRKSKTLKNNKIIKNIINNRNKTTKTKKIKRIIPFSSTELLKLEKKKIIKQKKISTNLLNDQELNALKYDLAIKIDKRNYWQFYFSILKKNHLILFTFWPTNDYNLIVIKLSLFLFTFSLYFTINGFFFTDESMHNVYVNEGGFDILYQIPYIIYSSIITYILNTILKFLSLSEKSILKLKKIDNINECLEESKKVEKCLNIKFIIFFIFSFIFMVFFWYYLSCFCAVYNNTQLILIEDTLFSFGLSLLYPFGLNLIPGVFRIPALRDSKKNKKCLYKISQYLSLV